MRGVWTILAMWLCLGGHQLIIKERLHGVVRYRVVARGWIKVSDSKHAYAYRDTIWMAKDARLFLKMCPDCERVK